MTQPDPSSITDTMTIEISDSARLPEAPLVSVYMLTYNHEKYIAEAIEGVISQKTDFQIELIIGEDCSTDRTGVIVREYQERYPNTIRILTSATNVGACINGNRCRDAARGEFVAICEGDDYWNHSEKLRMQVQRFALCPDAQLVHTDYDRQIGTRVLRGVNKRRPSRYLAQGNCFDSLLHEMTVTTSTAMYRRRFLEDYRRSAIDASKWPFGDYPIALYASLIGPVVYIPESTSVYRYVQESAMNLGSSQSLYIQKSALDCRRKFMEIKQLPEDISLEVQVISYRRIMRIAAVSGDLPEFEAARQWLYRNGKVSLRLEYFLSALIARNPILRSMYRSFFMTRNKVTFFFRSKQMKK